MILQDMMVYWCWPGADVGSVPAIFVLLLQTPGSVRGREEVGDLQLQFSEVLVFIIASMRLVIA